jgi:hypothetical protein
MRNVKRKNFASLLLALCLTAALTACGGAAETQAPSVPPTDAGAALTAYTAEGVGSFTLPEGFSMETGSVAEPLPMTYVTFEKDGWTVYAGRFGSDAYEAAGVPLPADVEDYSTRSGVQEDIPEGTTFAYDDQGNYAAQFTDEDGNSSYYVLLQGTDAFGSLIITAPADVFDAATAALWASGTQLD